MEIPSRSLYIKAVASILSEDLILFLLAGLIVILFSVLSTIFGFFLIKRKDLLRLKKIILYSLFTTIGLPILLYIKLWILFPFLLLTLLISVKLTGQPQDILYGSLPEPIASIWNCFELLVLFLLWGTIHYFTSKCFLQLKRKEAISFASIFGIGLLILGLLWWLESGEFPFAL